MGFWKSGSEAASGSESFRRLERAIQATAPGAMVAPFLFDKIHSDPRWLPFLHRIGKAPEQLAKIDFKVTLPDCHLPDEDSGGGGSRTRAASKR